MRRETQNVLLVLVGGALVKIVLDGTFLRYVRPWSGPVVLAAGVAILVLAAVAIVRDVRTPAGVAVAAGPEQGRRGDDEPVDEEEHHDHAHDHGSGRPAWLLLLPVLAILLVAPPALGSGAVTSSGSRGVTVADAGSAEPLPAGEAPALAVVDFVSRAAAAPNGPLTGRDVTLTGFLVAPGGGPVGGTTRDAPGVRADLARLVISCCAADASAVRVHLDDARGRLPALPGTGTEDRWVQVRGRLAPGTGTAADGHVPTLRVTESSSVRPPEAVYEY